VNFSQSFFAFERYYDKVLILKYPGSSCFIMNTVQN
jgi:hypothetical protein